MREQPNARLAARLKEMREHSNLSLNQLAKLVDVSKVALWNYEHARTRIPAERLNAIALVLGYDVKEFYKPPGTALPKPSISFRPRREVSPPPFATDMRWVRYLPVRSVAIYKRASNAEE